MIIVDSFLKSTLIPVCKELQSYVSNSLNYFNEIDLDFVLTDVLKIQPNAEPPLTSVRYYFLLFLVNDRNQYFTEAGFRLRSNFGISAI